MPVVFIALFLLFIFHYFISLSAFIPFKLLCIRYLNINNPNLYWRVIYTNIVFCFLLTICIIISTKLISNSLILIYLFIPILVIFEYFLYRKFFIETEKIKNLLIILYINILPVLIMTFIYYLAHSSIDKKFPLEEYFAVLAFVVFISYLINKIFKIYKR